MAGKRKLKASPGSVKTATGPAKVVVKVKYVAPAKSWCKTTFTNGAQKQEWSALKPAA